VSLVRILTTRELLDQPEPPWLIEDIMRADQIGVVYGPPNKGKTFLVLDWGLHIACGLSWQGHAVTQGPVLYMAGEGAFSLQKRVEGWLTYHEMSDLSMYFQCRPLDLRDDDVLGQLHEALTQYRDRESGEEQLNPRLVIVDTLSQFLGGGDENSSDMAQFVSACRSLSQEHDTAVLMVHHTNATGARERGHTALRGNTDFMFSVEAIEKDDKLTGLKLQNDKHRDDPKSEPLALCMVPCKDSLVISGPITLKLNAHVIQLHNETLRDLLICALQVEDHDKERLQVSDWRTSSCLYERTFYHNVRKLKDLKLVKEAGRGVYKLTDNGRATAFSLLPLPAISR
jgi:hypothetical protein